MVFFNIMGDIMGVGDQVGKNEIDERGRITIPKEIREKIGLKTGDRVRISTRKDGIIVEKEVDLATFIAEMRGCITVKSDLIH